MFRTLNFVYDTYTQFLICSIEQKQLSTTNEDCSKFCDGQGGKDNSAPDCDVGGSRGRETGMEPSEEHW